MAVRLTISGLDQSPENLYNSEVPRTMIATIGAQAESKATSTEAHKPTMSISTCNICGLAILSSHADCRVIKRRGSGDLKDDGAIWSDTIPFAEDQATQAGTWFKSDRMTSAAIPRHEDYILPAFTLDDRHRSKRNCSIAATSRSPIHHQDVTTEALSDDEIHHAEGDSGLASRPLRRREKVKQWLRQSGPRVLHGAATTAILVVNIVSLCC